MVHALLGSITYLCIATWQILNEHCHFHEWMNECLQLSSWTCNEHGSNITFLKHRNAIHIYNTEIKFLAKHTDIPKPQKKTFYHDFKTIVNLKTTAEALPVLIKYHNPAVSMSFPGLLTTLVIQNTHLSLSDGLKASLFLHGEENGQRFEGRQDIKHLFFFFDWWSLIPISPPPHIHLSPVDKSNSFLVSVEIWVALINCL